MYIFFCLFTIQHFTVDTNTYILNWFLKSRKVHCEVKASATGKLVHGSRSASFPLL